MKEVKTVAFYTLGCKLNFSETSTIARKFTENGYQRVETNEMADVYVINTCSVTDQADKKSRQIIGKLHRQNPDAKIAVVGCYSQLKANEISKIEGVSLVLGSKEKYNVLNYLEDNESNDAYVHTCEILKDETFSEAYSSSDRTRTFMKVQDGCDYFCSYCTIPLARGRSRNNSIDETIELANKIALNGSKEVILTGVNIGDFGKSTGETFFDLILNLDQVNGIERFRISSIEPNLLTNEIIKFVANSNKFMPHFHIPLQSGCDTILKKMRRKYSTDLFNNRVKEIRKQLPNAFIGVDIIVGFPGESDEMFETTYDLLSKLSISFIHVFSYSVRKNTLAAKMPDQVSPEIKSMRSKRLNALAEEKLRQFYKHNLGNKTKVLFEQSDNKGLINGFTENYIKVEFPYKESLGGNIFNVTLDSISKTGNCKVILKDEL